MTQEQTPTLPLIAVSSPITPAETTTPTLQVGLALAVDLAEARAGLALARYEEEKATLKLEQTRLACEKTSIETAGGEKALGPNEAAQKRALQNALEQNADYVTARAEQLEAQLDRRLAESDVAQIEAQHATILTALQARIFHVPDAWLYLPGEQRPTLPIAVATVPTNGSNNGNGHHPA